MLGIVKERGRREAGRSSEVAAFSADSAAVAVASARSSQSRSAGVRRRSKLVKVGARAGVAVKEWRTHLGAEIYFFHGVQKCASGKSIGGGGRGARC